MTHQDSHNATGSLCSSSKDLLQDLVFEGAFSNVNPRSLLPHLDTFEKAEDLQDLLDKANACVAAASEGKGPPIKNPHGFLFAQLKAGYINPPEGYKSRKLVAEEMRTRALQVELEEIQNQKIEQERLRFEIFKAKLTEDDLSRLEKEARQQINRKSGVSAERQIEVNKEEVMRRWFEQQKEL